MKPAHALALGAALLLTGSLHAQTVWRCGPTGAVYSDIACPGEGREVQVADARSNADLQAARAVAARDSRLAERLATESRRQALNASPGLAGIRSPAVLVPRGGDAQRIKAAPPPFTVKLAKSAA